MKMYVKCASNRAMSWLNSDRVDELMKGMTAQEKRIVGKIANSGVVESYVGGIIDCIDVMKVDVSDAFDTFLSEFVEYI